MSKNKTKILSSLYVIGALVAAACYWSGSPLYVLGFANPVINLWALAMGLLAGVFFTIGACLFRQKALRLSRQALVATAALFTLLQILPAWFYYSLSFSQERAAFHLAPAILFFLLLLM